MVLEAMQAGEQRQSTSVVAIKRYILRKYPAADGPRFKYLLKQALATGLRRGLLARPLNSKARGATGSFKSPQIWNEASCLEDGGHQAPEAPLSVLPHVLFQLVTNHERKIKPRKTASPTAPRRAGEARGKVPKKPDEAKEEPPKAGKVKKAAKSPAEVQKLPLKPGAATEKALKQGSKAKDTKAQPGEAQTVPPKPDKATRAPSSASGFRRKAEAQGSRRSQGPSRSSFPVGCRHPPVLRMVLEALQAGEQRRQGTSVAAIKVYILQKYPMVDVLRFKYLLKQALATGLRRGLLARPLNSKARGATGSFKVWDKTAPQHQDCHQPSGNPQGPDPGPDLSLLGPCILPNFRHIAAAVTVAMEHWGTFSAYPVLVPVVAR
ncbi:hypothetical protein P7K49_030656 [Saguinus oedipus]|uniref:H15 domain-containing protein n=1 Tax=Saguinus oedipus TaxID=9490 RepID=A0ABQ9U4U4_SAGOE|nr:hypothetical protein P7K49_030656 [Saguinus oedipus]